MQAVVVPSSSSIVVAVAKKKKSMCRKRPNRPKTCISFRGKLGTGQPANREGARAWAPPTEGCCKGCSALEDSGQRSLSGR